MEIALTLPKIDLKKIPINGKMYDVTSLKIYSEKSDLYTPSGTAIEIGDVALPIVSKYDIDKGIVGIAAQENSLIAVYNPPKAEDREKYSMEHCIDFNNTTTMQQLINNQERVRNIEHECLTNSNNITVPKPNADDAPEMVGLKQAITAKQCDISLYANRFDNNFANDRRILGDTSITLAKLKKFGMALDMKMTLTIEDANPNVANPMNTTITVDLLNRGGNE